jgi:MFS family permease
MCFALLSSTVVAPLYGKLSDIYGRRAMMLASIGIFVAGSAACAAAHDMIMLILGRGLQGIGGGGILPLAQAILADAVAPRENRRRKRKAPECIVRGFKCWESRMCELKFSASYVPSATGRL